MNARRIMVVVLAALLAGTVVAWLLRPRPPAPIAPADATAMETPPEPSARHAISEPTPAQDAPPEAPAAPAMDDAPLPPAIADAPSSRSSLAESAPPAHDGDPDSPHASAAAVVSASASAITGRVVDRDAAPVPGAWVNVTPVDRGPISNDPFGTNDGPVRTGADGRFTIPAAPGRGQVVAMLTAYRPGRSAPLTVPEGRSVDAGDVVLEGAGAGRLRARVVRSDGRPYAGPFSLHVVAAAEDEGARPASGYETFVAGADGWADPRPVTEGRYRGVAEVPRHEGRPTRFEVRAGADVEATFRIEREPTVTLRFVDDDSGAPVPDVSAGFRTEAGWTALSGPSDAAGLIDVPRPEPGRRKLVIHVEGYSTYKCGPHVLEGRVGGLPIDLPAEPGEGPIEVRLGRGRLVEGVVRDAEGRGVASEIVVVDGWGGTWKGRAGADGVFLVGGIVAGDMWTYRAFAHGGGSPLAWGEAPFTLAPETPRARVEITRGPGALLEGRVTGLEGGPVQGASVEAMPATEEGPAPRPQWNDRHAGRRAVASTDAQGRYRLQGLAPGDVDVIAHATGRKAATRPAFNVRAGVNALDLVLEGGGAIEGRLVDDRGEPVRARFASVSAHKSRSRGSIDGTYDGKSGTFRIDGLQDAEYDIWISAIDHGRAEVASVRPGVKDLVVRVPRSGRVRGRVVFPPGAPVLRECDYMVLREDGGGGSTLALDREGRFRDLEVDPGSTRLVLTFEGYPPASVDLPPLGPAETAEVVVVVQAGRRIAGRILGPEGRPVAGARAVAHLEDARSPGELVETTSGSDVEGRFVIEGAPRAAVRLRALISTGGADAPLLEGEVVLPAGSDVEGLEVRLAPRKNEDATAPGE